MFKKLFLLFLMMLGTAHAESIRLIIPYAPGGSADQIARVLQSTVSKTIPINIEYHPGAGGLIATNLVANNKNNETVLILSSVSIIVNSLSDDATYNIAKDFKPVANMGIVPLVMIGNKDTTIDKLMKTASPLFFGSSGIGTTAHISGELLKQQTKLNLTHVPYKGESASITGVMGNEVNVLFVAVSVAQNYVDSDKIRLLAVTGKHRNNNLPNIPTFSELGIKGFDTMTGWSILLSNSTADPKVIATLQSAITESLRDPEVVKLYNKAGVDIDPNNINNAGEFLNAETKKVKVILKSTKLK